ncbi:MAG: APC family permease [Isosphaeraceae bacterium]
MLHKRIGLLGGVSINMAMMVGMGPFITIPIFVGKMGGPHALIGWVLGALVAICDGLVWSELATAFPGSGGTLHFYGAIFGPSRFGRLLRFLFVWQFLVSAPMELASGGIGLGQYAGYLLPSLQEPAWSLAIGDRTWEVGRGQLLAVAWVTACVVLAYRRIEMAGKLMVVLWAGMLVTMALMIGTGFLHFRPSLLGDIPPEATRIDAAWMMGLGGALGIAMYDFLGYYQVCYLGDEVRDPERTLPRAILISVVAVASLYLAMNAGILGVIPWREVADSQHIASDFIERTWGDGAANAVTCLILWTGAASLFAGVLGYSRVPFAAARSGDFFRALGVTHPRGDFPHRSLLLIGALTAAACLFDLPTVIAALLASRIWIQFVGQILALARVHRHPGLRSRLRFRMALYPIPPLLALLGWIWVFAGTDLRPMAFSVATVAAGCAAFGIRAWRRPTPGQGSS